MNISRTEQHAAERGVDFKKALANVKRRHSFGYRSQFDRVKEFKGGLTEYVNYRTVKTVGRTLLDLAQENDIQGYVALWTRVNGLKGA